jgi:type IV secretory pathway VirB10-like protein
MQPASLQAGGLGSPEQRQNTKTRTIKSKRAILDTNTIRKSRNTSTEKEEAARGRHEVKAGRLIPAVFEQQLNSDLPGLIRALVRENVYDTVTGKYALIPAVALLWEYIIRTLDVVRKHCRLFGGPTIIVRPGYRFFVRVEKDLLFKAPYSAMPLRNEQGMIFRRGKNGWPE